MKKILILIIMMIGIPYLVTICFIKKDAEIKFYFTTNTMVRIKRSADNTIDSVPLEEYIVGVLAGEMPVSFDIEALKAQAVAARTYVMKRLVNNKNNDYDIVDTTLNQVYLDNEELKQNWGNNYTSYINKLKKAVLETSGEYITYDGNIIDALFFSTSVGATENSEEIFVSALPYLRSVDSSWDAEVSPVFSENNTFYLKDFYNKLNLSYSNSLTVEPLETTSTGRIKTIKINGVTFTGSSVASKLGIRSDYFSINQSNETITVITKGYGHGVGMSQYGAEAMAKKGYTYDEILKYYYKDVDIKNLKNK